MILGFVDEALLPLPRSADSTESHLKSSSGKVPLPNDPDFADFFGTAGGLDALAVEPCASRTALIESGLGITGLGVTGLDAAPQLIHWPRESSGSPHWLQSGIGMLELSTFDIEGEGDVEFGTGFSGEMDLVGKLIDGAETNGFSATTETG